MRLPGACVLASVAVLVAACAEAHVGTTDASLDASFRRDVGVVDAGVADAGVADAAATEDEVRAFLEALERAWCEATVRCESLGTFAHPTQQAHYCLPELDYHYPWRAFDQATRAQLDEELRRWREGLSRFDRGAAAACLTAQATACRPLSLLFDRECGSAFRGVGELGEPCRETGCVPGLYCNSYFDCRVEAICEIPSGPGGWCNNRVPCMEGLFCGAKGCEPARTLGETCSTSAIECADGLSCVAGRCARFHAELGEECPPSCADGLACTRASPDAPRTCDNGAAIGDPCDVDRPCGAYGRCIEGICVRIVLPGEECDEDVVCPSSFVCDRGRCAPLPVLGQSCERYGRCAHGVCEAGVCVPAAPLGAACDYPDDVPLGSCELGSCVVLRHVCPTSVGLGEPCDYIFGRACSEGTECLGWRCVEIYSGPDC